MDPIIFRTFKKLLLESVRI
uniref:Uncharacterized protein n=1 Tax=Rhizophora mucronata TaxID=61149 RepID=A0A2P2PTL2_RHIMU